MNQTRRIARMQRRQAEQDSDRWLVSYADFMTLLFAFFVVMYSISSVNQDKYRMLSEAMVSAFKQPSATLESAQLAPQVPDPLLQPDPFSESHSAQTTFLAPLREIYHQHGVGLDGEDTGDVNKTPGEKENEAQEQISEVSDQIEEGMSAWINSDIVDIKRNKFWIEVEINSSLLFNSASSRLIPEALPLLNQLSQQLVGLPNRIQVEGFTDNRPISTPVFPSNWELSSARAAAVVRLFEQNGVDSSRLASIGYGENRPIAENDNDVARAKNRRVVIVILAASPGAQDERLESVDLLRGNA